MVREAGNLNENKKRASECEVRAVLTRTKSTGELGASYIAIEVC